MNASQEQQQDGPQAIPRSISFDKDATIRSNRSNRSTRSSIQNMTIQTSPKITTEMDERKAFVRSHRRQNNNQLPPPPPYQPSHSPLLGVRRDSSPSTTSFESHRWDNPNRNPRWSTWTADSTLLLSDGNEDVDGDPKTMYINGQNGNSIHSQDVILQQYDDSIAGPSSPSLSRASTPPSPTSEAALDAALSSTMLALTTANSLLLSTMASRRELARLRALEAELDSDLTKKEDEIRRQIEFNRRTTRWMERACNRLEDVIQGRETLTSIEDLDDVERINANVSAPTSRLMARHDRASSIAATDSRQLPTTFGIVGAKDENATIGKSAAKRLERMLQRSSLAPELGPLGESPSAILNAPFLSAHSRASSNATSTSGPDSIRSEESNKISRPSALRHSSSSTKNALQLRPSMNKLAIPITATAPLSSPSSANVSSNFDDAFASERNFTRHMSSGRQSVSGRSESEFSLTSNSVRGDSESKASREEESDSNAAKLLNSIVNSRPTSRLSVNVVTEEVAEQDSIHPDVKTRSQFLTPPMPTRELGLIEGEDFANSSTSGATALLKRQSISNIRSPSAMRVAGGHARGSGSSVTDEVQGVAVTDRQGGRKGALEALRRLNSTGVTGGGGGETSEESNAAASNATIGWGGTFASWIGMGKASGEVNTDEVDPTA